MNKTLIFFTVTFILLGCNSKKESEPNNDLENCPLFFKSNNAGISIQHSYKWRVYEYKEGNDFAVGLTYYDTLDWERRNDAQIDILTRTNKGLDSTQVMKAVDIYYRHIIDKSTSSEKFKLLKDTTEIIDNYKWKKIEYLEFYEGYEPVHHYEYFFSKNMRVIMISIFIQNGSINNIEKEFECILKSFKITDLKSNKVI